jgi:hypothetical protein
MRIFAVLLAVSLFAVFSCSREQEQAAQKPAPAGTAAVAPASPKTEADWDKYLAERNQGICFQIVKRSENPAKNYKLGVYDEKEIQAVKDAYAKYVADLKAGKNPKEPQYEWREAKSTCSNMYQYESNPGNETGLILMNYAESPEDKIPTRMTSKAFEKAYPTVDERGGLAIGFEFNDLGKKQLGDMTEKYRGEYMAILLNGVAGSVPAIRCRIDGVGFLPGSFTLDEINSLLKMMGFEPAADSPELRAKMRAAEFEYAFWNRIQENAGKRWEVNDYKGAIAAYRNYISESPNGPFVREAEARIAELEEMEKEGIKYESIIETGKPPATEKKEPKLDNGDLDNR